MAAVREHTPWEVVARIARRIVGKHKDDVRVGYAETFHCSIPAYFSSCTLYSERSFEKGVHSQRIRHMLSPEGFLGARCM